MTDEDMDLLPCPFCGGEAELYEDAGGYSVDCGACGAGVGYLGKGLPDAKGAAVAGWNRRAERTCRMVDCGSHDTCVVNRELSNGNIMSMEFGYKQCSECGANVFDCPTVRYCPNCGARVVTADADR